MGTPLSALQIGSSYSGILKTTDNAIFTGVLRTMTDGMGNDSALQVSTAGIASLGTLAVTGLLTASGGVSGALNGTVGATTPAAGSFTTLAASSTLSASNFSGSHSGTSSGTNTGDQTTISGNAATATALQTARAINGVNFDGTAAITVPAAAGTLTGATLASGVTASSLTSLGTITTLVATDASTTATLSVGSTLSVTGLASLGVGALFVNSASSAQGKICYNTARGLQIQAKTGTVTDFILWSAAGTNVMVVPTGTNESQFVGILTGAGVIRSTNGTITVSLLQDGTSAYVGTQTAHDLVVIRNGAQVGLFTTTGLDSTAVGATSPSTGQFTTLRCTSTLQIGTAYVATPPSCTGYVTIKDSTGTTYKVLVST